VFISCSFAAILNVNQRATEAHEQPFKHAITVELALRNEWKLQKKLEYLTFTTQKHPYA